MDNVNFSNEKVELPFYTSDEVGTPQTNYSPSHNQPGEQATGSRSPPPPPTTQLIYVTNNANLDGMQSVIPIMPMVLAVSLCTVNIFFPGFGTMIGSSCVFCYPRLTQSNRSNFSSFCINFWIGWAQLLTIWMLFLGWAWSIAWGVLFISFSAKYHGKPLSQHGTIITTQQMIVNPSATSVTVTTVPTANGQNAA